MTAVDCRDRTGEFFSTIASFSKQLREQGATKPNLSPPLQERTQSKPHVSEFALAASHIGKGAAIVEDKLNRLRALATQRSLFNDPVAEINNITTSVKKDLVALTGELDMLAKYVDKGGGTSDSGQGAQNNSAIVNNLKSKVAHLTKSFAEVLQTRSKNLRGKHSRRAVYEQTGGQSQRKRADVPLLADMESDPEATQALLQESRQADDSFLDSRSAAITKIESTIVELGEMYKKLIGIIEVQNEVTIRIEQNVTDAHDHIERGTDELATLNRKSKDSQWLTVKVFGVLVGFAVFFAMFH